MSDEPNILRRHDLASLISIEQGFQSGPLAEAAEAADSIERRRDPITPEQFVAEYRDRDRPVVLEGYLADWPAVRTWSFDYLTEKVGETPVVVDSYDSRAARSVPFAEFTRLLEPGVRGDEAPVYLQEWYYQAAAPQLAPDLPEIEIAGYDFRRDLYGDQASTNHQLWLGQRGGVTRLHQDSYMVDVFHAQIVGTKRWTVLGPDAALPADAQGAPDFAALLADPATRLHRFLLNPGDLLFLPSRWFHRIELLDDSIGLGRKCLDVKHLRRHIHQRMAELLALSLNYDEVKQTHPELVDVVMARNRVWAKRMNVDLAKLRP